MAHIYGPIYNYDQSNNKIELKERREWKTFDQEQ